MKEDRVIAAAREWLGTPYRHQGSTLGAGCDCLGLLRGVWRRLYGDEPLAVPPYGRSLRGEADGELLSEMAERLLVREAQPLVGGQVVLFRLGRMLPARHCGILVSPSRFIHAQERLGVVEANLTEGWQRRIAGLFAFP